MREYTVKEVADLIGKHEETVKRWIRAGKLPNSYRNSDKEGWRILESDLLQLNNVISINSTEQQEDEISSSSDELELVKLAYEAVTLTSPTDEILSILSVVGIKRTLEILLIMQQSASKVKNPDGFIRKAIRENWSPTSTPIKMPRKQSKRVYELSQNEYQEQFNAVENQQPKIPFYNWLED
ncbi:helix-turn-helix domain-containing protein [Ureibacillus sp. Re31]|uniref:Helix-turn-helix domain-containing protein n=1 Tax=Ureibacillus galli TaxID=2762222 RepID=A0ABR8XF50_9BACL|nr:helix-turn-helix domain-containing protein [Ureibacillus galli]MBD8027867.1 helix-turn-helix domain-containing protein [Ureibacillus galli]